MQSLTTSITIQDPKYLGQALSPRYERLRSKLLEGARELLAIELQSCLKVAGCKTRLRRIHDLDHLIRRLRFLTGTLGGNLEEETLRLIEREKHFRRARFLLRGLRRWSRRDPSDHSWFSSRIEELAKEMRLGGLSNRDIRTTATEVRVFEKIVKRLKEESDRRYAERRARRQAAV